MNCVEEFVRTALKSFEAEKVLEELVAKRGVAVYCTSKMTLQEWRKGNIKFSYYQK